MVRQYPRLTGWAEENIEQTLTFFRLPRQHHKHLKNTNMLERLNEEVHRRTCVVPIFPTHKAACAWCAHSPSKPTKTGWRPNRHIKMDDLREHKKLELRKAA